MCRLRNIENVKEGTRYSAILKLNTNNIELSNIGNIILGILMNIGFVILCNIGIIE